MNKIEFVRKLRENDEDTFGDMTLKEIEAIVDSITGLIIDSVENDIEINLAGFGKFYRFTRHNGSFTPKFKPFKNFRDIVKSYSN